VTHNHRIVRRQGESDFDLSGAIMDKLAYNADRDDHKIDNRRAFGGKKT
jgi:hypothetical protein